MQQRQPGRSASTTSLLSLEAVHLTTAQTPAMPSDAAPRLPAAVVPPRSSSSSLGGGVFRNSRGWETIPSLPIDEESTLPATNKDVESQQPWALPQHLPPPPPPSPTHAPPHSTSTTSSSSRRGCGKRPLVTWCVVLLVVAALLAGAGVALWRFLPRPGPTQPPWVEVQQQDQVLRDCRPQMYSGFNAYDLPEVALGNTTNTTGPGNVLRGRRVVRDTLRGAAGAGLNLVRTFTHSSSPDFPWQVSPGVYNPDALLALDWVVAEAGAAGIQVVLSLTDNWKYYNGADQYVDWSPTAPRRTWPLPPAQLTDVNLKEAVGGDEAWYRYEVSRHTLFFRDPGAMDLYRRHVSTILNRVNAYTGVAYKEDPTILAWNLINEPRCETWVNPDCPNHLHDWLASMAAYVRSLDARHLITYGSEGFFGPGPNQGLNPYVWMADLGQDWVRNNQIPDLDYASLHVWPENWGVGEGDQEAQVAFVHDWVLSHLQVAQEQLGGKLVMLEEFGKKMPIDPLSDSRLEDRQVLRDPVFAGVHALAQQQQQGPGAPGNLLGTLFWRLHVDGGFQPTGPYGVELSDSTGRLVEQQALALQRLLHSVPPSTTCSPGPSPSTSPQLLANSSISSTQATAAGTTWGMPGVRASDGVSGPGVLQAAGAANVQRPAVNTDTRVAGPAVGCWLGRFAASGGAAAALDGGSAGGTGVGEEDSGGRRYCVNSPSTCDAYSILEVTTRKLVLLGVSAVTPGDTGDLQPVLFGPSWQAAATCMVNATAYAAAAENATSAPGVDGGDSSSSVGRRDTSSSNSAGLVGGSGGGEQGVYVPGVGYVEEVAYGARGLKQLLPGASTDAESAADAALRAPANGISASVPPSGAVNGSQVTPTAADSAMASGATVQDLPQPQYVLWVGGSQTALVNYDQLVNLTADIPQVLAAACADTQDLAAAVCDFGTANMTAQQRVRVVQTWLARGGSDPALFVRAPSPGVTSWVTLVGHGTQARLSGPAAAAVQAVGQQLVLGAVNSSSAQGTAWKGGQGTTIPLERGAGNASAAFLLSGASLPAVVNSSSVTHAATAAAAAASGSTSTQTLAGGMAAGAPQSCSALQVTATTPYSSTCLLPLPYQQPLAATTSVMPCAASASPDPPSSGSVKAPDGSAGGVTADTSGAGVLVTAAMVDQALQLLLADLDRLPMVTCPHKVPGAVVLPSSSQKVVDRTAFAVGIPACGCDTVCVKQHLRLAAAIMKQQQPVFSSGADADDTGGSSIFTLSSAGEGAEGRATAGSGPYASFLSGVQLGFYPTQQACCLPGLGAFQQGCSA